MKIYTKTGDKGETALLSGARVSKDHPRLWVYGDLDEVNSLFGLLKSHLQYDSSILPPPADLNKITDQCTNIQNSLFVIASHIACDKTEQKSVLPTLDDGVISTWEAQIDQWEEELPVLKNFILPSGSISASLCHVLRTVIRRSERRLVQLMDTDDSFQGELILKFLNRLSDYTFVLARWLNHSAGLQDDIWKS